MHVEDDTLNSFSFGKNINYCTRPYNNYGCGSCMDLPCDKHLCDTVVPENTGFVSNNRVVQALYEKL